MPEIGEVRKANEIGYKGRSYYVWYTCEICGKECWVSAVRGKPISSKCQSCANAKSGKKRMGERNHFWKGGRHRNRAGYILVMLQSNDFFYPMAQKNGYMTEHRLVMAKHLGRCLQSWELVHHKNGTRDDNRIENLELVGSLGEHIREHSRGYRAGYAKGLVEGRNKQIQELKDQNEELLKQVRLLLWKVKEKI